MIFLQATAQIDNEAIESLNDSLKAVTETIIQQAHDDPAALMHDLAQKAADFGLKLLAALAIYIIGIWIIRRIKGILNRAFTRHGTEGTLASFVTSLVSITLTVILIVISIGTLGINTTSIAALLAAGGMAIGMALSGTVSNFAGGLMLLIFKPFKAGDFITAQGYSGTVMKVSIAHTTILTTDNREIIIPNGALSNGNIDNCSTQPLRRVDIELTMEYGTDADKCIDAILEILRSQEGILDSSTPGAADPFTALSALNDSSISFITRTWVNSQDYWSVRFALNKALYTGLSERGFSFAFPHMDVTLKN